MESNVVVNNELQACQTNPFVRQLAEIKCQLGIANVHRDLDGDLGQVTTRHFSDLGLNQAIVNIAFIALRTRHSHHHAVLQFVGRIPATHYRRNSKLARNDGGVASTTTAVGDNS